MVLSFAMNEFKMILAKLKEIIALQLQRKKISDKDVATALDIKPTTFASYKRRDKLPYQAILTYCHNNRLDVRKVLFSEDKFVINYPTPDPIKNGKVRVRYFRSLDNYSHYIGLQK